MMHCFRRGSWFVLLVVLGWGCGRSGGAPVGQPVPERLLAASELSFGVGDAQSLQPSERAVVREELRVLGSELLQCFAEPIVEGDCRTGGQVRTFDAAVRIDPGGKVAEFKLIPNRNQLAAGSCNVGVECLRERLVELTFAGLAELDGPRRAYLTVKLRVPHEDELPEP